MRNSQTPLLTIAVCFLCAVSLLAQELSTFEVVNNESIGLTVAPFEKWGVAFSDIDRNGYPDIFCPRWKTPGYSRVYVNSGGKFTDISGQTPLPTIEAGEINTTSSIWVDYDNDGDRDLSLATEQAIHLLRNDNNVFTEVSAGVGFVGQKPPGFITKWIYHIGGWADYDLDGDLDCAVTQDNNKKMYLFRNDGGHFTNVSAQARLDSSKVAADYRFGWFDFDLDGDPDLIARPAVLRNDNGVFTDVTAEIGLSGVIEICDKVFIDYDNDGDFDFFKSIISASSTTPNQLWENQDGHFVNVSAAVGLETVAYDYFPGMAVGDLDNDGDVDIFLNRSTQSSYDLLLSNDLDDSGTRTFVDVAEYIGITNTGNRKGAGILDYDRDGFLDIYLPADNQNHILYHNMANNQASWVGFILEGTVSNRDAVGSLATLYTANRKQVYYTTCGNGFLRQDNPWVHFGLGTVTTIDSVVIRWPLGYRQVIKNLAINQYHQIKEPEQTRVAHNVQQVIPDAFRLDNYPNPFNANTTIVFDLNRATSVTLDIHDITGRLIRRLVNQKLTIGEHRVSWDGRDDFGRMSASGTFIVMLTIEHSVLVRKLVLLR